MTNEVTFRKIDSGETRAVKVGWSWTLFLFGPVLGIPFFLRKAYPYGLLMIAWNVFCLILPASMEAIAIGGDIGLAMWLGRWGNRTTAQYYLGHGWEFADPDSESAALARAQWSLA